MLPLPLRAAFAACCLAAVVAAQTPLGPGPGWRGPRRPTAANEVFATGDGCAMCHSAAPTASALRNATGDDVSPHELWQSTMMANSFRDPYWRAQVQKEVAASGPEVQALCIRCHAPMAHHTAMLGGEPSPAVRSLYGDALAHDGVSCTVCHQIRADGLGTDASFSGRPVIGRERQVFGPFAEPAGAPMQMMSRYVPTEAAHVQQSKLCGSCHTLFTQHDAAQAPFAEQTPYLEWRNSSFSDEPGANPDSRTCQQCHMPQQGELKIARNPMGRDFLIQKRPFAAHLFVGGNAFMLDLLAANRELLGVEAPLAGLQRTAAATRRQLAEDTVHLAVGELRRQDGTLQFEVELENLTGHKFPTGYPSRRAWLHVQVTAGGKLVFQSGAFDAAGALVDCGDELDQPHRTLVERPQDVVIYEMVANDKAGAPTTHLTRMVERRKDNRLLPRGWRADGPDAAITAPVGTAADPDFAAGGDRVAFRLPLAADAGPLRVVVWLHYQTVPPAWVEALRHVDAAEAKTFCAIYDAAAKLPETVAVVVRSEAR